METKLARGLSAPLSLVSSVSARSAYLFLYSITKSRFSPWTSHRAGETPGVTSRGHVRHSSSTEA